MQPHVVFFVYTANMHVAFFFIMQINNNPESLAKATPARNAQRFVQLTVVDGDSSYFLQVVVCSVKSFTKALFLWFALYYIFNLEYEKIVQDVGKFFQEFCLWAPMPREEKLYILGHDRGLTKANPQMK